MGVAGIDLGDAEPRLLEWLAKGYQGEMHYMARHGSKRARPAELVPGTLSVICARMNYLSEHARCSQQVLDDTDRAFVAR